MAKFNIVGCEHNKGVSKKTGKPYDMYILHAVSDRPMSGMDKVGCGAYQFPIDAGAGILRSTPVPGEVWEIEFNMLGRIEAAYAVN